MLFTRRKDSAALGAQRVFCLAELYVFPWLAVTDRVPTEYLVVQGWIRAPGLKQAVAEFEAEGYRRFLTSGCLARGEGNSGDNSTYADWSANDLREYGVPTDLVTPIPCWADRKDRTYHSALAVKQWFHDHQTPVRHINVVTLGAHARRTRLLFQKAFGSEAKIGVIAAQDQTYDSVHWWRSSEGVREVIGESIAYLYAKVFFVAE